MKVYRANSFGVKVKALTEVYQYLAKVVTPKVLNRLKKNYVLSTPAAAQNLNEYGETFIPFVEAYLMNLSGSNKALDINLVSSVTTIAQLDWALHRAYYGLDARCLDASGLDECEAAACGTDSCGGLDALEAAGKAVTVERLPSVTVIAAPINLNTVKEELNVEHGPPHGPLANHDDGPINSFPSLNSEGGYYLVWRSLNNVQVTAIDQPLFSLLQYLGCAKSLEAFYGYCTQTMGVEHQDSAKVLLKNLASNSILCVSSGYLQGLDAVE